MTTYAVNDKHIIAVWCDERTLRWEVVTPTRGLPACEEIADALGAVSHLLWQRCEFLGEQERLDAIVRSGLRRNGSEFPNRRRPKVEPAEWDRRTQAELTGALRTLAATLEGRPDPLRGSIRAEVLRELGAVYTWAAGGRDRQGRVGQMPLPCSHRVDPAALTAALHALHQRGVTDRVLNDATRSVLTLLLTAAAVATLQHTPQGRGRDSAQLLEQRGVVDPTDSAAALALALDLVLCEHDPVAVVRAVVGDADARRAGLVDPMTYAAFTGRRAESTGGDGYAVFADRCTVLLEQLLQATAPAGCAQHAGPAAAGTAPETLTELTRALVPRVRPFVARIGTSGCASL